MTDETPIHDRILDAALRLAADRRWTGITLRDIAGEAGLGLTELNAAVASRAAILSLFNRRILEEIDHDEASRVRANSKGACWLPSTRTR